MNMYQFIGIFSFIFTVLFMVPAGAVTARAANYVAPNTYNNMYPYLTNKMRTNLNNGNSPSRDTAQINVLTRTYDLPTTNTRRVVPRRTARAATTTNTARVATSGTINNTNTTGRRVVARRTTRAATNTGTTTARAGTSAATTTARAGTYGTNMVRATTRGNDNVISRSTTDNSLVTDTQNVSSSRCLADYTACMDDYCEREDTKYNRCYCSAKLSQIDATYQPEIERLIKEILVVQNTNKWTQSEMNEYWMSTVGKYTGDNSWEKLDDALNIDWAGTESRVHGQQAFATGHQYCVQHLRGCFYMAGNMRDAYRTQISRDCTTYETSLQILKNAAESIVGSYK